MDTSSSEEDDPNDSDYSDDSDEECEDSYWVKDCQVKAACDIRRTFYPNGYTKAAKDWKALQVAALAHAACKAGEFKCPQCNTCKNNPSIDHHPLPVVKHWNKYGYNQSQIERNAWYNDTTNMRVMCVNCNGGLGGGDVYDHEVGPKFSIH